MVNFAYRLTKNREIMETKHTQGKWMASPDGRAVYSDENKCLIAMCEGRAAYPIDEREANRNAKLIAAAPDLLTALEVLLECSTAPHWKKQLAKKAIQKATT